MNSARSFRSGTSISAIDKRRLDRALVFGTFAVIAGAALPIGCGGQSEQTLSTGGHGAGAHGGFISIDGGPSHNGGSGGVAGLAVGIDGGPHGGGSGAVGGRPVAIDGGPHAGGSAGFGGGVLPPVDGSAIDGSRGGHAGYGGAPGGVNIGDGGPRMTVDGAPLRDGSTIWSGDGTVFAGDGGPDGQPDGAPWSEGYADTSAARIVAPTHDDGFGNESSEAGDL